MKVSTHDLIVILRQFGQATDDDSARAIDQVAQSHPTPINQLIRFRFKQTAYFVLLDDTAEDSEAHIMDLVRTAKSDVQGEVLQNPISELATFGLPYKGKDIYLVRTTSGKRRLDVVLSERYPDMSRSMLQKYIKAGNVSVNGQPATSPSRDMHDTDDISIDLPEQTDYTAHKLPILYIDDDVVVVNKPAGILTHAKGGITDEFTVAEFFRRYTSVGLDSDRPGIVHRLDRDTSGIIIGARTPEAYTLLTAQFADRKAKKTYLAVTNGIPKQPVARIDVPIGRNPSAPSTFRADSKGKAASTDYTVLATDTKHALVRLEPHTGRTHQLRVHMAYIGTPILGDRVYGKAADRLYLHAWKLDIAIGLDRRHTFVAPVPEEFTRDFSGVKL